jgi:hypothetical protein
MAVHLGPYGSAEAMTCARSSSIGKLGQRRERGVGCRCFSWTGSLGFDPARGFSFLFLLLYFGFLFLSNLFQIQTESKFHTQIKCIAQNSTMRA